MCLRLCLNLILMTKNGLGAVCEHLVQKCWLLVALVCFSVLPVGYMAVLSQGWEKEQ